MCLKFVKEKRQFDVRRDEILKVLYKSPMSDSEWECSVFSDYDAEERFLAFEQYLKETSSGFQITPKGIAMIKEGGFVGARRRENLFLAMSIITAILAAVSVVVQFILK